MNVLSKQPLRTEMLMLAHRQRSAGAAARRVGVLAGVFGFCCFMPYVALAVGNRSAVQLGNILAVLMVLPVIAVSWRNRPFWIFLAILAPMCISTLKVAMAGEADPSLCFKVMSMSAFCLLCLLPTQLYVVEYSLEMITGIAIAAIVHTLMGMWQWHAFAQGYFPLPGLFENQAFLSVKDNAEIIAKYTQRPFGVFPEPSAMSASLAPWAIFWIAEAFGLIRLHRTPARWQRIVFGIAAAGALGLIILSRSGHAMITLAVVTAMSAVWFVRCRATLRNFMAIVSVCWVALPVVLVLSIIALSDRLGGGRMGNSSWEDRSDSLIIGFKLLVEGSPLTLLFGVGIGQTSPILQSVHRLEAVWSITLTYVYETGLVGLVALCAIGRHLFKQWKSVRYDFVYAGMLMVWLVGVTITTSYQQLLSLWVTMGVLTVWSTICQRGERVACAAPARRPHLQARLHRRPRWSDACKSAAVDSTHHLPAGGDA